MSAFLLLGGTLATGCARVYPLVNPLLPKEPAEAMSVVATPPPVEEREAFREAIPSAAAVVEMLPIPGDEAAGIKPYFMSKTEIPWEVFDVYAYQLDAGEPLPEGVDPDAISRPSKPYLPPDRGFGHDGYAAISMSHKNATEFCTWLSARTGRTYRLPTVDEWRHAALAGSEDANGFSDDPAGLAKVAWFEANASATPHPVGEREANAWGLHDMYGNVMEWCTDAEGKPAAMGGSYLDAAERLTPELVRRQDSTWNGSDPQVPKSKWWLSDGPFMGFRVVCEVEGNGGPAGPEGNEK